MFWLPNIGRQVLQYPEQKLNSKIRILYFQYQAGNIKAEPGRKKRLDIKITAAQPAAVA